MREEHFVELKGKRHVLYSGLLAMAHEQGIESIEEEILQIPDETNGQLAICRATVTTKDGQTFMGIGDASPQNVGRNIVPHILRMASTRSKARALRDMCNVGVAALEELSDGDEASAPTQLHQGPQRATESRQEASVQPERTSGGASVKAAHYLTKLLVAAGHDEEKVVPHVQGMSANQVSQKITEYEGKGAGA